MARQIGIGALASGGGSNFQALTEAVQKGTIPRAAMRLLICNRPAAGALARARDLGVEAMVLEPGDYPNRATYFARIAEEFLRRDVGLICLAGFLLKLEATLMQPFRDRILNIHPALLPAYGGKGMYGRYVHEAVIRAGDKESGCTVHLVDAEYDHGPVVAQVRVPVLPGDTPDTLAARVLEKEHQIYPEAVKKIISRLPEYG